MSGSNCCFLTCIQVSQETGKVVWYSHLFKNFPQFVVIHTVKGFSIAKEAEIDVVLKFPCFFCDPTDFGNLISGSSAFSKSSLFIWKFSVHVLLKLEGFGALPCWHMKWAQLYVLIAIVLNKVVLDYLTLVLFFFFTVCMHFYFKKLFGSVIDKSKQCI